MCGKDSIVAAEMQYLCNLICEWEPALDKDWVLVYLSRADFEDQETMLYARRQALINSAGCTRFWEWKFRHEPFSYHRFFSPEYLAVEQHEERLTALAKRLCCLGLEAKNFRMTYDTLAKMRSRECRLSVQHAERTTWNKFHNVDPELQHASDKKFLNSAARGRTWVGHAQSCVISHAAVDHINAGGLDVRKGAVDVASRSAVETVHPLGDALDMDRLQYDQRLRRLTLATLGAPLAPRAADTQIDDHGSAGILAIADGQMPKSKGSGKGGNPLWTMMRDKVKSRKAMKGENLTMDEYLGVQDEAREEYIKAVLEEGVDLEFARSAYQDELEGRRRGAGVLVPRALRRSAETEGAVVSYTPRLGVGGAALPIPASAMAAKIKAGLPSEEEVKDEKDYCVTKEDAAQVKVQGQPVDR